jgi:DNA-directed RNA polymerase specialized sigma24 family protein
VTLSEANLEGQGAVRDALDVELMLTELAGYDSTAAEIVSLRVFGGLSIEETAEVLGLAVATVNRRWLIGKAWLGRELTRGG